MPDRSLMKVLNSTTKSVFTTQDLNKLWQYENYRTLITRINYLSKTGKLVKIQRGLYSIAGRDTNILELANKLRTPSYITFETVLLREGVIFQWDDISTLAGKDSEELEILGCKIKFRKLKDEILLNPKGINKQQNYFIASKERALLDMLYIQPKFAFDNLRTIEFSRLYELANIYNRKSIVNTISKLEEHARSY